MQGHRRLLAVLFANFLVFGAAAIVIGATAPKIIRQFGWTYTAMGAVLAAGSAGYFASTFLCGVLVHAWGPRLVICATLLLQVVGLWLFGSRPSVLANLLAVTLVGVGQGGTEIVTNYCVVRMERPGGSRLMNLVHAAFPAGAIAGSLGMGLLLEGGVAWQAMYRVLAVLCLLLAGGLSLCTFSGMRPESPGESSRAFLRRLLGHRLLLLYAAIILTYVGVEIGVSSWISEYFVGVLHADVALGAAAVSLLWAGLLLGRFAVVAGWGRRRQGPLLLLSAGTTSLALCLALLARTPLVAGTFFLLTGAGCAAVYPVIVVLVGQAFPRHQGMAIGVVSTVGGVGSFAFPFLMAAIAQEYGMAAGFWFVAAMSVLLMAAAAAAAGLQPRSGRP
ncbi:MAG: MFS transporter [Candidatus Latescibacterota bacterium]